MSNNSNSVRDFFNSLSGNYVGRYSKKNPFHYYFFNERLVKSLADLDLNDKNILDVGAGTGVLYDALIERFDAVKYFGNDIAEEMLKRSKIPIEQMFHGSVAEKKFPAVPIENAFMLGVSTYLQKEEMEAHLDYFSKNINQNGLCVVSFTNKYCLDGFFRSLWKPIVRLFFRKHYVLSSSLNISKHTLHEAAEMFEKRGFAVERVDLLNHTVFPVNLILPKFSVWLAQKLDRVFQKRILSVFSSDFLIRARKI